MSERSAGKLAKEPALPLVRIIIGQQTCSARVPASADSAAQLYSHARILLLVDLDVAFGDESSVAVREIRTGDADEKRVLARTSLAIVSAILKVCVPSVQIRVEPHRSKRIGQPEVGKLRWLTSG
jgi:hypothetical protein